MSVCVAERGTEKRSLLEGISTTRRRLLQVYFSGSDVTDYDAGCAALPYFAMHDVTGYGLMLPKSTALIIIKSSFHPTEKYISTYSPPGRRQTADYHVLLWKELPG